MLVQYGGKMTCRTRPNPCCMPDRRLAEPLLSSELGFASRGGLQQAQALANDLFRVSIAIPLISELQTRRVQAVEVGPPEATIGRGLWRKQGTVGATHFCLRMKPPRWKMLRGLAGCDFPSAYRSPTAASLSGGHSARMSSGRTCITSQSHPQRHGSPASETPHAPLSRHRLIASWRFARLFE